MEDNFDSITLADIWSALEWEQDEPFMPDESDVPEHRDFT